MTHDSAAALRASKSMSSNQSMENTASRRSSSTSESVFPTTETSNHGRAHPRIATRTVRVTENNSHRDYIRRFDALQALIRSVPEGGRTARRNAIAGTTAPEIAAAAGPQPRPRNQARTHVQPPSLDQLRAEVAARELRAQRAEERARQQRERLAMAEYRLTRHQKTCTSDAKKLREEERNEDEMELREHFGVRVEEDSFEAMVAREMGRDTSR